MVQDADRATTGSPGHRPVDDGDARQRRNSPESSGAAENAGTPERSEHGGTPGATGNDRAPQNPGPPGSGETPGPDGPPPDAGMDRIREVAAGVLDDPWFTLPNALSALRLAGVALFLWLLLGPHADLLALLVLVVSGATDWLDGKLARWLNQYSRVGQLLDPAADRLYIIATLVAFVLRDVIPWWAAVALIARDVLLTLCLPVLRYHGYEPPDVHYLGKAATFCLMYAFPLLLLVQGDFSLAGVVRPVAYAFTCWGGALYLWAGVLYLSQVAAAVRVAHTARRG